MYDQLWPALNEIDLAVKNVENWMKDETRTADAILSMKTMRELRETSQGFILTLLASRVRKEPKGVALVSHTFPSSVNCW